MRELVKIKADALRKILYHSLLFGGEGVHEGEFKMVLGFLGGRVRRNVVFVEDAYCLSHGELDFIEVDEEEKYGKAALYNDMLSSLNLFIVGWYCSIKRFRIFYNSTNRDTQAYYQDSNGRAVVLSVYPEDIVYKTAMRELVKIYRLRNPNSFEYSQDNWTELSYQLADVESNEEFLTEIKRNHLSLFEKFDIDELEESELNKFFSKTKKFK